MGRVEVRFSIGGSESFDSEMTLVKARRMP